MIAGRGLNIGDLPGFLGGLEVILTVIPRYSLLKSAKNPLKPAYKSGGIPQGCIFPVIPVIPCYPCPCAKWLSWPGLIGDLAGFRAGMSGNKRE